MLDRRVVHIALLLGNNLSCIRKQTAHFISNDQFSSQITEICHFFLVILHLHLPHLSAIVFVSILLFRALHFGQALAVYFLPLVQNHWLGLNYSARRQHDEESEGESCVFQVIFLHRGCQQQLWQVRLQLSASKMKSLWNPFRSAMSQITFHAQLFRWIIGAANKNGTL